MAIDKALNQAPLGLQEDDELPQGPEIEIEIEEPEAVRLSADGIPLIEYEEDEDEEAEYEDFNANLAEQLDEGQLTELAGDLLGDFETDLSSRKDWMQTYVDGLELLGMKIEERTEPWPGACGIVHPLLSEALVKFQSETIMETFPAAGPVKTQIIGKETQEKKDAAVRVRDDMNYQLTERMVEYRPEHERMWWGLGLAGGSIVPVGSVTMRFSSSRHVRNERVALSSTTVSDTAGFSGAAGAAGAGAPPSSFASAGTGAAKAYV